MFLKVFIFEFLFGYFLQSFTFVLGIYAFCRQKIQVRKYIATSIMLIASSYILRMLPISFGVHTLLNLLMLFILSISYLKTPISITLRSTLFVTILLLLTEMLNVVGMIKLLGQQQFELLMTDPLTKAILALPTAFSLALIILISYFLLTKNAAKNVKIKE